ncbi:MAG: hypothetical protein JWO91_3857, partial [Acidobacteriaceae bacterium]|nr:hypothetical protein [Acidobacteriaceae bacterium]
MNSPTSSFPFISGPVAQLGARFHGMEEVVGSIPTRSTNNSTTYDVPFFRFKRAKARGEFLRAIDEKWLR